MLMSELRERLAAMPDYGVVILVAPGDGIEWEIGAIDYAGGCVYVCLDKTMPQWPQPVSAPERGARSTHRRRAGRTGATHVH